jgi:hypothetical protein
VSRLATMTAAYVAFPLLARPLRASLPLEPLENSATAIDTEGYELMECD